MNIDKAVLVFAGIIVLSSVALSQVHHINWLWLTAFAGFNMIQAAFTGFCPAAIVFRKLGLSGGVAFKGLTEHSR